MAARREEKGGRGEEKETRYWKVGGKGVNKTTNYK